jgi:DNA-binding YbaB/EbfC family protein
MSMKSTLRTTPEARAEQHDMKDLMGLMKQAQAMQAKMAEMQTELEQSEVQGQSGAGLVKVTLTAKGNMKAIAIDPSLLKTDEGEILEDLIVTAHEDARKKAERLMEEKMKSVTAGLPLPPGLKLPF